MTRILRIYSSSRPGSAGSRSRALAGEIVRNLYDQDPKAEIITRDLASVAMPHISNEIIAGFYTPTDHLTDDLKQALALSDELIAELKSADAVVISVPIYNFSVPSALKAWIDHVMRINLTFSYEDGQFGGLLTDRPTYLAYAYGAQGYGAGGMLESYDHMRPFLNLVLNFMGNTSISSFSIEATTADEATVAANMTEVRATVSAHFDAA